MVPYDSFDLHSLSPNSNGDSRCWLHLEMVSYKSGRKESLKCIVTFVSLLVISLYFYKI